MTTTRELLTQLAFRMERRQNSTKGRDLGALCREALEELSPGVLNQDGPDITTIYFATRNSDQTEGRGHRVTFGFYKTIEEAVEAVQGHGVMGVGPGEVIAATLDTGIPKYSEELVYGYRKDLKGVWGYGYVDNRDQVALREDPEFKEFLRLKEKFSA